jgi:hypothetical protein
MIAATRVIFVSLIKKIIMRVKMIIMRVTFVFTSPSGQLCYFKGGTETTITHKINSLHSFL